MKHALFSSVCSVAIALSGSALAGEGLGIGLDLGLGTTGISANVQYEVIPRFVVRGGYNYLEYDLDDEEYDDVLYSGTLDMSTIGAYLDVHPFGNGFTLTGGFAFGNRELALDGTPTGTVEIGDDVFNAAEVGTLTADVGLGDGAPYAGIGWDSTLYGPRIALALRAGVLFAGAPEVDLRASGGTLANDANFLAELEREEQKLNDEIEDETFADFYPVLSLHLAFRL